MSNTKITMKWNPSLGGAWIASSPDSPGSFYIWRNDVGRGYSMPLGERNKYYRTLKQARADLQENWQERCEDTHFRWTHWDE